MNELKLSKIIDFIKSEKLPKKDVLYLLKLYDNSKDKELTKNDMIYVKDIKSLLKKVKESLKDASDTKVVNEKVKMELEILEQLNELSINFSTEEVIDIYYQVGLLSYEEDLNIEKAKALLDKKILGRKN